MDTPTGARGGFTLIELLMALVLGLVVTASSLNFAISVFRNVEGDKVREEVYRNSRFIGMSLNRDIQVAGVGIESEASFGTVSTFNDTLVILHIPYEPTWAVPYDITTPGGSGNPLPPGGTCGTYCIQFNKDASNNYDLAPGDLARLQVNTERHLVVVESVNNRTSTFEVTITPDTTILGFEAGFQGGLLLDNVTTFIQKIDPIVYFVTDSVLYRGDAFDSTGALQSFPVAYGVTRWDTSTLFLDGDESAGPDASDGDNTNDFDDILGVRVVTTLGTNRPIRTASGELLRDYEWLLTPRNLMYERNR